MTKSELRLTEDGRISQSGLKIYPNGDRYLGDLIDGLREGQGTLTCVNGNTYRGQFKANRFHGTGYMKYGTLIEDGEEICGRVYKGGWEKGVKKGEGVLHTGTGQVYEGCFQDDQYHGPGVLRGPGEVMLDGEWKRGKLDGEARCRYKSGVSYTGGMRNAEFDGMGKLVFGKRGGLYEGEFKHGVQNGFGIRTYLNGSVYEGVFRDGVPSGEGTMHYASGDMYVGEWQRGQREGKGVLSLANGDRYDGSFLEGQIHGRGHFMWSDGGHYEGGYMATAKGIGHDINFPLPNGLRHGQGKRVWANGAIYEGRQASSRRRWEDDRMEGKGTYVCASGSRYEGEFRGNHRHGRGKCQWGNRCDRAYRCPLGYKHEGRGYCIYVGEWKLGKWEGQGNFRCVDHRIAEGTWKQGRLDGWGTSVLMPAHEQGDPRRMFIGGVGGLYRILKYYGQWSDGVREGVGLAEYANRDRLVGNFVNSHLNGFGVYIFGTSGRARAGFWRMGTRERWVEDEEVEEDGSFAATILRTIRDHPGAFLTG
ncbi:unnamed protein product, partial [Ascophyllum nodosum]